MSPVWRHLKITGSTEAMSDLLMDVREFCELLGITEPTAYYWRQIGKGPQAVRIGKRLRYRRDDVESWIDSMFAA